MKNLSNNMSKYALYFAMIFLAVSFTGCSSDDDVREVVTPDPTGSITAQDQTISQNTIIVESVTVGQDSWLVARHAGQETSPDIVSEPVFLEAGTHTNVELPLENTAQLTGDVDGDEFVLNLHADDQTRGTRGEWDYDGMSGIDPRIKTATGQDINQNIRVTSPRLTADDNQMVTEEGDVMFSSVNTGATGGFIGLHAQNPDGTPNFDEMVGASDYIEPGEQANVTSRFMEGHSYEAGQTYFPRLYMDDPSDQQFTYTQSGGTEDMPEMYGFDQTTGQGRHVLNTATTATQGGFTVGNTGVGTGPAPGGAAGM